MVLEDPAYEAQISRAQLVVSKPLAAGGAQNVQIKGRLDSAGSARLRAERVPDPVADGVRIRLLTHAGQEVLDAILPAGATDASGAGWRMSPAGNSAIYRAPNAPDGLNYFLLKWQSRTEPGTVQFSAQAKRGNFWIARDDLPLVMEASLEPSRAVAGECGQLAFSPAPDKPSCVMAPSNTRLTCR